jgi:hypothetical protein
MIRPAVADLNQILLENLGLAFAIVAALLIVLLALLVVQSFRLRSALRRYEALLGSGATDGSSLGELLEGQAVRVTEMSARLSEVNRSQSLLEERTRTSLRHIGMIRFNPFEDTGSDQSFAIALLDDARDGIVLSSLHGRANTRLFAKPVENGVSRHTLSDEESQAIRIAVEGTSGATG